MTDAERLTAPTDQAPDADMATLARGGRLNVFGFVLRLAGMVPFLFIGGRIYGPAALGRFVHEPVAEPLLAPTTRAQKRTISPNDEIQSRGTASQPVI